MNVDILQENLLKALTRTGRILSSKPQLPILATVLLTADESGLKLVTTNMETTTIVAVPAKITAAGSICIPSRVLTEFVSSLSADTVHLVVKDGSLLVSCGRAKATMPGTSSGEFPPVLEHERTQATSLPKDVLAGALSRVLFSAASDDGRPLLTGIKVRKQGDTVLFAATDGYRLSMVSVPLAVEEAFDVVIPARALGEVLKVSAEEKEATEISLSQTSEGQVVFTIGDTEIVTRLIAGDYPPFERIVPKTQTTRSVVDTEELMRAVRSAAIFARDNANIIKFHIQGNTLTVSANTPQVGENSIEVEAKTEGEGGEIAFNSRFLVEFLNNYTDDQLVFEMTGSLNPGVFKPIDDSARIHVIMPVRVSST